MLAVMLNAIINNNKYQQYRCFNNITGTFTRSLCSGATDTSTCSLAERCLIDPCGFKMASAIDISVAGHVDRTSTTVNSLTGLMLFWSLIPYLLAVFLATTTLLFFSDGSISPILLLLIQTIVNEGILKNSIQMDRPDGSCLYGLSYGMPSGHACTSIGMLAYLLFETHWNRPEIPTSSKLIITLMLLALLLPVPFSRVYLHDHYPSQVFLCTRALVRRGVVSGIRGRERKICKSEGDSGRGNGARESRTERMRAKAGREGKGKQEGAGRLGRVGGGWGAGPCGRAGGRGPRRRLGRAAPAPGRPATADAVRLAGGAARRPAAPLPRRLAGCRRRPLSTSRSFRLFPHHPPSRS